MILPNLQRKERRKKKKKKKKKKKIGNKKIKKITLGYSRYPRASEKGCAFPLKAKKRNTRIIWMNF
jgi:hypothetical protein